MKFLFKASLGSWPRVMPLIGPIFITEKEREREFNQFFGQNDSFIRDWIGVIDVRIP